MNSEVYLMPEGACESQSKKRDAARFFADELRQYSSLSS